MINNLFKYSHRLFSKNYAPRWLILQIDLLICMVSVFTAYVLRYNFDLSYFQFSKLIFILPFFFVVRLIAFKLTRTYAGIIRYSSFEDAKRLFIAISASSIFIALFNTGYYLAKGNVFVPYLVIILDFVITLLLLNSFRMMVKLVYIEFFDSKSGKKANVIIYGAGRSGLITKRTMDHDGMTRYKIVAFIDDDPDKIGKTLEGVTIFSSKDFESLVEKSNANELIFSIQNISVNTKRDMVDRALKIDIAVKSIPPVKKWINGELSLSQIKNVKIEDLLERDQINLDRKNIAAHVNEKVILVTGASGSIGSELVRQLMAFFPSKLILLDVAESPLYDLQLELESSARHLNFIPVIGDVRNQVQMEDIFATYLPDMVFHAAAYKHVPLMEDHPSEAVHTNVKGTKILADLSVKYHVKKFVMVSTDKAVNPTNVMGASKRIAEIYCQSLHRKLQKLSNTEHTRFITTRFGNVLGSNGSVIPRFRKQILEGGPVTVTHPEICRYFMTIPEACQLILEAGAMGQGGEIYIFDMGQAVKIVDLANKMIKLSGFIPGKDIQIVFSGLRPGEKIKEELLNIKESTLPTHHEKIMVASVREYKFEEVNTNISSLINLIDTFDKRKIVGQMKNIVPEFKSHNSVFEVLDTVEEVAQ